MTPHGRSPSVPSSVQVPDKKPLPGTQTWRPGEAPLRRTATLLDDSLLATINQASYQQPTQFSARCCLKNTHFPRLGCPSDQLSESYAACLPARDRRDNYSVLPPVRVYEFFTNLDINFTSYLLRHKRPRESVPDYLAKSSALGGFRVPSTFKSDRRAPRFSGPRLMTAAEYRNWRRNS
jgi:hypothetical protein